MNWFQGEIVEAIAASKAKEAIFVVYIEGKNAESNEFTSLINSTEISRVLGSDKFVAIRIEADSVSYQQFSQIYKQVPVPSIYFIGKQGVPLEILTDHKTISLEKLNVILQKGGLAPIETSTTQTNENKQAQQSNDLIQNEQAAGSSGTAPPKPDLTIEEKVERAKEIVERKRLEKQKEEEEKEKQKEIERRKMGQSVQQLKRWQDEQELKNVLEERKKEKLETQAARERVLAQIAQDKAERAARFSNNTPIVQQPQAQSSPRPINTNLARLQFRLPDGSTATNDFSSSDTFAAVHAHIRAHLNLPFTNYTLSTTFPRREFTEADKTQTLLDLGLVPTAVILILPLNRGTVSTNTGGGGLAAMFWSLLAPVFAVLDYLKGFVFGNGNVQNNSGGNSSESVKRPNEGEARQQPKMRRGGETTVVRRQGNVHRLARNDSDDENNTWNGNSTQQM